jgi:hypothetical protein
VGIDGTDGTDGTDGADGADGSDGGDTGTCEDVDGDATAPAEAVECAAAGGVCVGMGALIPLQWEILLGLLNNITLLLKNGKKCN